MGARARSHSGLRSRGFGASSICTSGIVLAIRSSRLYDACPHRSDSVAVGNGRRQAVAMRSRFPAAILLAIPLFLSHANAQAPSSPETIDLTGCVEDHCADG